MHVARALLTLIIASGASTAWGLCVDEGKPLPPVSLNDHADQLSGKIVYDHQNNTIHYLPWSSTSLTGNAFVIYHLAARKGIDNINRSFISMLDELPPQGHQLVVILNVDDVFTGGKYFARKIFEGNAKEHASDVVFVLDENSTVQQRWCIDKKSSTLILVNIKGEIVKAKDGALTAAERLDFINAINYVYGLTPGASQ